jgi:hypothetical protein
MSAAIFLIVTAAMVNKPVMAEVTWFCAVGGSPDMPSITRYRVVGKEMTSVRASEADALLKSYGVHAPETKYQILEDTPQEIIAVHRAAAVDENSSGWVTVVLLNKRTGMLREVSFSTEPGEHSVRGHCVPG